MQLLRRIANEFKHDYVIRFSKEMKRARELGEMDEELFTPAERDNLHMLINQPEMYYKIKALPMNNGSTNFNNNIKEVKAELDKIKRSKSYPNRQNDYVYPRQVQAPCEKDLQKNKSKEKGL